QTYKNIEHIIIDGKSSDDTLKIINEFHHVSKIVSEKDLGIYYALNKGIKEATGNIIGFLHADDFLSSNNTIELISDYFLKNKDLDAVYGDLEYILELENKKIRFWKSETFEESKLKKGWMPPHPTLYTKAELYTKYGHFNTNYLISADYDLILRFFKNEIKTKYIPKVLVKMRIGGASNKNIKNIIKKTKEDFLTIRKNKIGGLFTLLNKNISKISQFWK
ncbi:MAG: glycosyltransferase family 2 protein, partial [Bacteroidota bacterium]|nr:glycosyltransferase family 2 protein [Bacteroidota bacterium]